MKKSAKLAAVMAAAAIPAWFSPVTAADNNKNNPVRLYPDRCSVYLTQDANMSPGQSDAPGDRKGFNLDCRFNDKIYIGVGSLLDTPQRTATRQYDTGKIGITAGYENPSSVLNWGAYARAGWLNGGALDALHDLYRKEHELMGYNGMRTSPEGSTSRPFAGIAARMAPSLQVAELPGNGDLRLTGAPFATIGNDETSVGGQAYLSLMFNSRGVFTPPAIGIAGLPGMPDNTGTGIFGGVQGRKILYDVRTDRLGTADTVRMDWTAGGQIDFGRFAAIATMNVPMTQEVKGSKLKDVSIYTVGIRLGF